MDIRKCTLADVPALARLNKQLIEDEQSDNPMNVGQLEERMRGFLEGSYEAFFFTGGNDAPGNDAPDTAQPGESAGAPEQVIGYALADMARSPVYLRQFFICRDNRREHCGTRAFKLLTDALGVDTIDIEVLPWNERGMRFWKSLGFEEKCVAMQLRVRV